MSCVQDRGPSLQWEEVPALSPVPAAPSIPRAAAVIASSNGGGNEVFEEVVVPEPRDRRTDDDDDDDDDYSDSQEDNDQDDNELYDDDEAPEVRLEMGSEGIPNTPGAASSGVQRNQDAYDDDSSDDDDDDEDYYNEGEEEEDKEHDDEEDEEGVEIKATDVATLSNWELMAIAEGREPDASRQGRGFASETVKDSSDEDDDDDDSEADEDYASPSNSQSGNAREAQGSQDDGDSVASASSSNSSASGAEGAEASQQRRHRADVDDEEGEEELAEYEEGEEETREQDDVEDEVDGRQSPHQAEDDDDGGCEVVGRGMSLESVEEVDEEYDSDGQPEAVPSNQQSAANDGSSEGEEDSDHDSDSSRSSSRSGGAAAEEQFEEPVVPLAVAGNITDRTTGDEDEQSSSSSDSEAAEPAQQSASTEVLLPAAGLAATAIAGASIVAAAQAAGEEPDFVSLSMAVNGVDYSQLMENVALKSEFEASVKSAILSKTPSIREENIYLQLSGGSVIVEAKIVSPLDANPANLFQTLKAVEDKLPAHVASEVASIKGIQEVCNGDISVEVKKLQQEEGQRKVVPEAAKRDLTVEDVHEEDEDSERSSPRALAEAEEQAAAAEADAARQELACAVAEAALADIAQLCVARVTEQETCRSIAQMFISQLVDQFLATHCADAADTRDVSSSASGTRAAETAHVVKNLPPIETVAVSPAAENEAEQGATRQIHGDGSVASCSGSEAGDIVRATDDAVSQSVLSAVFQTCMHHLRNDAMAGEVDKELFSKASSDDEHGSCSGIRSIEHEDMSCSGAGSIELRRQCGSGSVPSDTEPQLEPVVRNFAAFATAEDGSSASADSDHERQEEIKRRVSATVAGACLSWAEDVHHQVAQPGEAEDEGFVDEESDDLFIGDLPPSAAAKSAPRTRKVRARTESSESDYERQDEIRRRLSGTVADACRSWAEDVEVSTLATAVDCAKVEAQLAQALQQRVAEQEGEAILGHPKSHEIWTPPSTPEPEELEERIGEVAPARNAPESETNSDAPAVAAQAVEVVKDASEKISETSSDDQSAQHRWRAQALEKLENPEHTLTRSVLQVCFSWARQARLKPAKLVPWQRSAARAIDSGPGDPHLQQEDDNDIDAELAQGGMIVDDIQLEVEEPGLPQHTRSSPSSSSTAAFVRVEEGPPTTTKPMSMRQLFSNAGGPPVPKATVGARLPADHEVDLECGKRVGDVDGVRSEGGSSCGSTEGPSPGRFSQTTGSELTDRMRNTPLAVDPQQDGLLLDSVDKRRRSGDVVVRDVDMLGCSSSTEASGLSPDRDSLRGSPQQLRPTPQHVEAPLPASAMGFDPSVSLEEQARQRAEKVLSSARSRTLNLLQDTSEGNSVDVQDLGTSDDFIC